MLNDQASRDHFDRVLRTITPNSIHETPNLRACIGKQAHPRQHDITAHLSPHLRWMHTYPRQPTQRAEILTIGNDPTTW